MYVHTYCTCRRGGEEWEGRRGRGKKAKEGIGRGEMWMGRREGKGKRKQETGRRGAWIREVQGVGGMRGMGEIRGIDGWDGVRKKLRKGREEMDKGGGALFNTCVI